MKLFFSELAQNELQDAVTYYDEISSLLGDALIKEVKQAEKLITVFPFAWTSVGNHQRKYILKKISIYDDL